MNYKLCPSYLVHVSWNRVLAWQTAGYNLASVVEIVVLKDSGLYHNGLSMPDTIPFTRRSNTFLRGNFFLNLHSGRVESKLGPLDTSATHWPIVPAPGDCEVGEFGGMNGRGNRSTRRKPAPTPLCPPQIPLDHTRDFLRGKVVPVLN
jgi:hypothetical protein